MKPQKNMNARTPRSTLSAIDAMRHLLTNGRANTQENIRASLAKQGIVASQSKISRLLRKLGAIKICDHQKQTVYSMPVEPLPPPKNSPLGQLILDIVANETMIVIRTNPGSASLIARLLDHHYQTLEILGTLAGDDTLFVVPKSIKILKKLTVRIKTLLGESS